MVPAGKLDQDNALPFSCQFPGEAVVIGNLQGSVRLTRRGRLRFLGGVGTVKQWNVIEAEDAFYGFVQLVWNMDWTGVGAIDALSVGVMLEVDVEGFIESPQG